MRSAGKEMAVRVMLVEDHPVVLWGLTRLLDCTPGLELAGTAERHELVLEQALRLVPDVIVLDMDLDGQSSADLIPVLCTNGMRILLLTGCRDTAVLDEAVMRGARGVVGKDAPPETLLAAIGKVAGGEMWLDREAMGRVLTAMVDPKPTPEAQKINSLTARERKIIHAFAQRGGVLNKELAQELFISEHTLRNHFTSIYQKLGLGNRLELYVYARKHGLDVPSSGPQLAGSKPAHAAAHRAVGMH